MGGQAGVTCQYGAEGVAGGVCEIAECGRGWRNVKYDSGWAEWRIGGVREGA